jgi:hypothetical protein
MGLCGYINPSFSASLFFVTTPLLFFGPYRKFLTTTPCLENANWKMFMTFASFVAVLSPEVTVDQSDVRRSRMLRCRKWFIWRRWER